MHAHWSVSAVLALFLVLLFVVSLIIVLALIVKQNCDLEADRANVLRAQLLTLLAVALGVLVLVSYRVELSDAVHNLMA